MQLKWVEEIVALKDLKPYKDNPRRVSKEKFDALVKNIETNGYTNRIIVNHDNIVLAGNQRLKALKKLKYELVTVLKSTKPLTIEQQKRINITDNLLAGEWDFDMLSNSFDAEQLVEWGMSEDLFDIDDESEKSEKAIKQAKKCPHCGELL